MVIDAYTYNGESAILEIRMNILGEFVDEFIIIEFDKTFSGKPKQSYFERDKHLFEKWKDKIKYFNYSEDVYFAKEYTDLAETSPNVPKGGAENWFREFCQKESIKKALTHLKDDDICFIGDVDEIWTPTLKSNVPEKLKLKVHTYYLNNRSSEEFWGPIRATYGQVKDSCLNHLRTTAIKTKDYHGWHFTSMGGYEEVKRKLDDSYTEESYNTPTVQMYLEDSVNECRDFLGRPFTYQIEDLDLPHYIRDNRDKYKHLFKLHE